MEPGLRTGWLESRSKNASNHIALGESYPFCNRSLFPFRLNRSLVHVDLPLDAHATLA